MKTLHDFDMTNFPRMFDGKTFRTKKAYTEYLISAGHVEDPNKQLDIFLDKIQELVTRDFGKIGEVESVEVIEVSDAEVVDEVPSELPEKKTRKKGNK